MRHVYLIEDSEKHWVAADLLGDAMLCWAEINGYDLLAALNEADPCIDINKVPGAHEIVVHNDDGKTKEVKTASEWAASFDRPTFFCSSVW